MNTPPNSRQTVSRAYEFVLNRIGQDKDNGEICSITYASTDSTPPITKILGSPVPTTAPVFFMAVNLFTAYVSTNPSFATQSADEKPPKSKELQDHRSEYGLVWIMYIRYTRQAHNLKTF